MAGAAPPAPVTVPYTNSGGGGATSSGFKPSELNAFRISAVIDRLTSHFCSHDNNDPPAEFMNLCLSLSRGIDFAISNQDVSNRARELPSLIKQICQNKNDTLLQAAIMVLMFSIKSACRSGWFSDGDSEELSNMAKEIGSNFGIVSDFNPEPSCSLSVISTVMSRYFPRMKMGHIFVSLEVKPGFEAYIGDFQISKNLKTSPGDKIRLFVVQTESIETSSCLVTPAKVNFLLNGKGVERRINIFLDTGPQVPTIVTHFLKYGANLLQAVGEFNGNYIIAIASMSELPNPESNILQDYEQHTPATVDADSEVIEGPSRISLNCPISFRRIRTPVKGHSCNHIQCFDFDNYVDINSRRPSWRCPHCNQHVCFTDIRIDQKMVKILKEVGPKVSDIIVSSDGSWKAVTESEDTLERPGDNNLNTRQIESPQPADVLDLTQTDDVMDAVPTYETQDTKLSSIAHEPQFVAQTTRSDPQMASTNDVNQSSIQVDGDYWSEIYMSTFGLGPSNVRPTEQTAAGAPVSSAVLTEPFTSPSREVEVFHHNTAVTNSAIQTGTSLPNTSQFQQYQFRNPSITNEYGRFPSIPRHITRTPTAVQALPAQAPSILQRSSTNGLNSFVQNGLSAASQASPAAPNLTTSHVNLRQVSPMTPSSSLLIQQHSSIQLNSPCPSARSPHQNSGFLDPRQVPNMYRVSNEQNPSTQPMTTFRVPRAVGQSPGMIQSPMQSSGSFLCPQTVHRTSLASGQQSHAIAAANRTAQISIESTRTGPQYVWNPEGRSMATPPGDQRVIGGPTSHPVNYDPADLSWRPPVRMRGALSGQAYTDYYNQQFSQPNQQAQAANRPISNMTSPPPIVPPQLQALMVGGVVQGIPQPNLPNSVPVGGRPMGSDNLPNGSSGLH